MPDLRELYQQVILDHSRQPRNLGALPGANRTADGNNPLCGDEIRVYVRMDGDVVREASFQGSGCAISKASASIMTDVVKGKTKTEAQALFRRFHEMLTSESGSPDLAGLGKLAA